MIAVWYFPTMNRIALASTIRGLYKRVADETSVDPSYVSRIARGERKSKIVEKALHREVHKILAAIRITSPAPDKNQKKRTRKKGSLNIKKG
jgi:hypothetical protein